MSRGQGLYVLMISVHGLVRGEDIELGRDADTGGQVKYVIEHPARSGYTELRGKLQRL